MLSQWEARQNLALASAVPEPAANDKTTRYRASGGATVIAPVPTGPNPVVPPRPGPVLVPTGPNPVVSTGPNPIVTTGSNPNVAGLAPPGAELPVFDAPPSVVGLHDPPGLDHPPTGHHPLVYLGLAFVFAGALACAYAALFHVEVLGEAAMVAMSLGAFVFVLGRMVRLEIH